MPLGRFRGPGPASGLASLLSFARSLPQTALCRFGGVSGFGLRGMGSLFPGEGSGSRYGSLAAASGKLWRAIWGSLGRCRRRRPRFVGGRSAVRQVAGAPPSASRRHDSNRAGLWQLLPRGRWPGERQRGAER